MRVHRPDFDAAAAEAALSLEQRERLWAALGRQRPGVFCFEHVTAYLGALVILCALGGFGFVSWQSFNGAGLLALAVSYGLGFLLAGQLFWVQPGLRVQGDILVTLAVCMVPFAIYGLEKACGWEVDGAFVNGDTGLAWVKKSGLFIHAGTVVAALVAIRWFRFPGLAAPIAFALWLLVQEGASYGHPLGATLWKLENQFSLAFGLGLLGVGFLVDRWANEDFAFWLYLIGLLAFQFAVSLQQGESEVQRALYCLLAVGFIAMGTVLRRRTFLVFGAWGICAYLLHLSARFSTSLVLPLALLLLGGLLLFLGVQLHTRRAALRATLEHLVPAGLRTLLPPRRE